LAFLVAGFVTACWAPLAPFAKARLGVDEGELGLLLLCAGVGSLAAANAAGPLTSRVGSRPVIVAGGLGLCLILPALAVAATSVALGLALLGFGASLGAIDVSMNAHAVEVEGAAGRPLMSGFHALYSLGGFAGAALMTLLLTSGATALMATLCASALALIAVALAAPRLLATRAPKEERAFAWPSGVVLVIAGLAAVSFLAEGAVLDWGALLVLNRRLGTAAEAGLGFGLFSVGMTVGRLTGDWVVARLGRREVLAGGGVLAILGFATVLLSPATPLAMGGFLLIGLGLANVVPVLFSAAGRQRVMPPSLAIAAITTTGYVGILAGPPMVGFVARAIGLPASFWVLAGLVALVPLLAKPAAQ
jgi:predicted MFS family arabinose efflux permease